MTTVPRCVAQGKHRDGVRVLGIVLRVPPHDVVRRRRTVRHGLAQHVLQFAGGRKAPRIGEGESLDLRCARAGQGLSRRIGRHDVQLLVHHEQSLCHVSGQRLEDRALDGGHQPIRRWKEDPPRHRTVLTQHRAHSEATADGALCNITQAVIPAALHVTTAWCGDRADQVGCRPAPPPRPPDAPTTPPPGGSTAPPRLRRL